MRDSKLKAVETPACLVDPLSELVRQGARELIRKAVEAELSEMLTEYKELKLPDGRQAIVRNGYLPERTIQTGIGEIAVQVPKVRDRSVSGIHFTSALVPPYLRRSKSMEELIPWLYLKGISTGDFGEALSSLVGENAQGLSANTVCRLKADWIKEYQSWRQCDLSQKRYVYWWADGVYSQVRMDDKLCLLVIIGVTEHGNKELVAVYDGFRESSDSWAEVLLDLKQRGLSRGPELAVGDGALGFWNALSRIFPETGQQRCWVHKTANVLNKLPKCMHEPMKSALHQMWMAPDQERALKAFQNTVNQFKAKYPKAIECLEKDKEELFAFYDFPAEHWSHIRTTNPIESVFATVRLRTKRSRNCGSRETTLAMVFKLMESAQKRWYKIGGFSLLTLVANNVPFKDGIRVSEVTERIAA